MANALRQSEALVLRRLCEGDDVLVPFKDKRRTKVCDVLAFVPRTRLSTFRKALLSHRADLSMHNIGKAMNGTRFIEEGMYDSDPAKQWNPLYDFANRRSTGKIRLADLLRRRRPPPPPSTSWPGRLAEGWGHVWGRVWDNFG